MAYALKACSCHPLNIYHNTALFMCVQQKKILLFSVTIAEIAYTGN